MVVRKRYKDWTGRSCSCGLFVLDILFLLFLSDSRLAFGYVPFPFVSFDLFLVFFFARSFLVHYCPNHSCHDFFPHALLYFSASLVYPLLACCSWQKLLQSLHYTGLLIYDDFRMRSTRGFFIYQSTWTDIGQIQIAKGRSLVDKKMLALDWHEISWKLTCSKGSL